MKLDKKTERKADRLLRDLVVFLMQYNPRPEKTFEEVILILFDETIEFIESLKDKLYEKSPPMKFLKKKELNRRMVIQESSWVVMDNARRCVHIILDQEYHLWGKTHFLGSIWKDER